MEMDVVIDVVCPWCFVGKRQLDRALEMRPGVVSEVRYRPYQLSPETPAEGVDRNAYYEKKFGNSPQFQTARKHLLEMGEELGITFDFESECRIANTLDAHRLMRWGLSAGAQEAVAEGLMRAYFEKCQFIGDHGLLIEIAAGAGMDSALVADLLASDRDKELVEREVANARQMGISGVPMFIFDGKGALSGAQGAEMIVKAIDQQEAA
ncbi:DsbA family oxidoreductase [Kordiimonas aestuarii]|uniref:DsbA family oxidoreductase n=1 Tax=Kordiimonas aestuarii TaxID=1005925 RepID=UPI0021D0D4D6|nr:DsbA family oxidoreductase [Kordiimonas aestuarii]